jgi:UBX domain-containing protein 1
LKPFQGAGYRLGSGDDAPGHPKPLKETVRKERRITIQLWTDGFTVDNGELRRFDDPASATFLAALNRGEIPPELQRQLMAEMQPGEGPPQILVDLEQKATPYAPPPRMFQTFAGSGRSLADPPSSAASSTPPPPTPPATVPLPTFQVDDERPATTLQIRLADGTRLPARFNLHHTIADIRNFIDRSRPQTRPYDIITTMPRQVYSDGHQTIEAAGLKNGTVLQHLL